MNTPYFSKLSNALHQAGVASPVLLIDKQLLDHNIRCLKETLDKGYDYRVVAKSLPSIPLLEYILEATCSNRLMCFHLPFLVHIAEHSWSGDIDILLGKPMPVKGLRAFYQWYERRASEINFKPEAQIQWLVDTLARLDEYEAFATKSGRKLRINLEIDVGLHRGGFHKGSDFKACLERIRASENLELSGLMGYDMHVSKAPILLGGSTLASLSVKKTYEGFVKQVDEVFGSHEDLCLNAAGSPTYSLYGDSDFRNELSIASALVKPSDFDIPTLAQHRAAAFIASPVLKTVEKPEIPLLSGLSSVMRGLNIFPSKACFIYGGNWMADPCHPQGSERVKLFGHSSNQEMYSLSNDSTLETNDYMFFRPRQSEALFLQFGKIAVYDQGEIIDWWPVFDASKAPRWVTEVENS
jgi:D-serine deaminase-like pyridoxal phosphate-dependent protein